MIQYAHPIKIYYRDVDKMGIVYYSRYFEYFEESRTELFSSIGLDITCIESKGITLPVISTHCDFKKSAQFEDKLLIKTSISEKPRSTIKISYKAFLNNSNDLLVKGYTIHAFLGKNGKPRKPPNEILLNFDN